MEAKLIVLKVDDWEAIYLNGEVLDQGHSLDLDSVLSELIGYTIDGFEYYYCDNLNDQELDGYGNTFPKRLEDVKEYPDNL